MLRRLKWKEKDIGWILMWKEERLASRWVENKIFRIKFYPDKIGPILTRTELYYSGR